jgi:DNA (cytosine-5)-methyltransferase 1
VRFGSVCSGIEAASVAWQPLGWKAAWLSEIEPAPCSILAHHYPDTPNLGDMTKFESWPHDEQHAIDLLCGGTPCQSFSVAGLRKGLDDPRGDLMLTFGAIAAKYRPKWLVWENVPGVLSSNGGRDFAGFLGLVSGQVVEVPAEGWGNSGIVSGYKNAYGLAYRVLDAQYFGVAQRRRRVFVVGHLGDWRSAAAVLFECHSLSGNPAPRRGEGKDLASCITAGAFSGGASGRPEGTAGNHFLPVVARCLTTGTGQKLDFETDTFVPTYGIPGNCIGRKPENGGNGLGADDSGVMYTLTKTDVHAVAFPIDTQNMTEGHASGGKGFGGAGDPSFTLTKGHSHAVCVHGTQDPCVSDVAFAQGRNNGAENALIINMQVRRLTPTECERLQGFPDNYTNVPHRGKPLADGPRYKALGNSWAVPCARWIGERIQAVEGFAA